MFLYMVTVILLAVPLLFMPVEQLSELICRNMVMVTTRHFNIRADQAIPFGNMKLYILVFQCAWIMQATLRWFQTSWCSFSHLSVIPHSLFEGALLCAPFPNLRRAVVSLREDHWGDFHQRYWGHCPTKDGLPECDKVDWKLPKWGLKSCLWISRVNGVNAIN